MYRPLHSLVSTSFVLVLAGWCLAAEPLDATTRDFDQIHLNLRVEVDVRDHRVDGEARLRFAALVDDFRRLRLHCVDTEVKSVTDGAGAAADVRDLDG